jgi:KamA family protein
MQKKILQFYNANNFEHLPEVSKLKKSEIHSIKTVSYVLPFKVNNYVVEQLIDWNNIPDDPIFQLTFPQKGMLKDEHYTLISDAILDGKPWEEIIAIANEIRMKLNPHPAGQLSANVARLRNGEFVPGIQHKYRETVLIFPSAGQTCHSYCTFCFRWAQFIGNSSLKFATDKSKKFMQYLLQHKEVTDVLITGGDPMIMSAAKLRELLLPMLAPEFEHIKNIRIGTKSLSYWPYRYISDSDSDEILWLFEKVINSGKHLSIMAHVNHFREISTNAVKEAIRKIRDTGAEIRTQSPLIKHINDDAAVWSKMWKDEVRLGMIPYYFFIERDTGAKHYFAIPLVKAFKIFREAYSNVSGLIRTVRGPSMSALPGKIEISGLAEIGNEKVFVLNFIQARNPSWVRKPFFAKFDPNAVWLDELQPALGDKKFFYEDELREMLPAANLYQSEIKRLEENLAG